MPRPRIALALLVSALAGCTHHHGSPSTPSTASPGSGVTKALWVANGTAVVEFLPSQLASGGDQSPHVTLASPSFGATQGVAFDAAGDLWVVDGGTIVAGGAAPAALYEFTPSQLASLDSNQSPTPTRSIAFIGFSFPQALTFDAGGNLWVTDSGRNAVFEYTASQLAIGGGNATPNVQITASPAFVGALGIAFSPAGNLWVANSGGTTLDEFDATALPTAFGSVVTLAPNVVIRTNGQSIQGPWGLAFDKSGNLWATNANAPNTVVRFSPVNLAASGAPTPFAIASASDGGNATLVAPNGLAFDNLGDLAVISAGSPYGIPFYAASQLTSGGAVQPHTFLVGGDSGLFSPAGAIFGPIVN